MYMAHCDERWALDQNVGGSNPVWCDVQNVTDMPSTFKSLFESVL